ncbi:hypothetical protein UPYG_G00151990 [Umbra pygmaea]|uniref:Uncharacterized protein n=1 Tax=Umbra pygmaea TaxID=75934 RepID=A0ABD0X1M6_UMBPY
MEHFGLQDLIEHPKSLIPENIGDESPDVNATLSPRMAHSVTWNRFGNGRVGKGRNIPPDLHLEHLNNFLKSFMNGLGANLNESIYWCAEGAGGEH